MSISSITNYCPCIARYVEQTSLLIGKITDVVVQFFRDIANWIFGPPDGVDEVTVSIAVLKPGTLDWLTFQHRNMPMDTLKFLQRTVDIEKEFRKNLGEKVDPELIKMELPSLAVRSYILSTLETPPIFLAHRERQLANLRTHYS